MGKEDIKASEMVCCQRLESKQGKEEIYIKGQPSTSCWSRSVLNTQGGRSSRVESRRSEQVEGVPIWRGCTVQGVEAPESRGKYPYGGWWTRHWESRLK